MRGPLVFSILFHIAILIAAVIQWPSSDRDLVELGSEQSFEVVAEAEIAEAPPAPVPEPDRKSVV